MPSALDLSRTEPTAERTLHAVPRQGYEITEQELQKLTIEERIGLLAASMADMREKLEGRGNRLQN